MSFLSKFRNAFSRKRKSAAEEVPSRVIPPAKTDDFGVKVEEKKDSGEIKLPSGEKKEKKCPFCHAPNDGWVSTCWMCKKKI